MALQRKGSRRIVVGEGTYRWRLRGKPTYDQGMCWSPCSYAVEAAGENGAAPGSVLVVLLDRPHTGNWVNRQTTPVLPAEVADHIHIALRLGWTPARPGPQFLLDLSAGFTSGFSAIPFQGDLRATSGSMQP